IGDRVRGVRLRKGVVVEGVVRAVTRLSLSLELDGGLVDLVYPDGGLIEPNPAIIQQYEYDSRPKVRTELSAHVVGNKLLGRKAYLTREEDEYDTEDISEFLGEPFEIRELTIHWNTEVPF